jgi:hypothetical protein
VVLDESFWRRSTRDDYKALIEGEHVIVQDELAPDVPARSPASEGSSQLP